MGLRLLKKTGREKKKIKIPPSSGLGPTRKEFAL
jgi:hypothetical protein